MFHFNYGMSSLMSRLWRWHKLCIISVLIFIYLIEIILILWVWLKTRDLGLYKILEFFIANMPKIITSTYILRALTQKPSINFLKSILSSLMVSLLKCGRTLFIKSSQSICRLNKRVFKTTQMLLCGLSSYHLWWW